MAGANKTNEVNVRSFASIDVLKRSEWDLELIVYPETAVNGVRAALKEKQIAHGTGIASDLRVVGIDEFQLGDVLTGVANVVTVIESPAPTYEEVTPPTDLL